MRTYVGVCVTPLHPTVTPLRPAGCRMENWSEKKDLTCPFTPCDNSLSRLNQVGRCTHPSMSLPTSKIISGRFCTISCWAAWCTS